jgi:uncharacterized protein
MESIGTPARAHGKKEIAERLVGLLGVVPDLAVQRVEILIDTPDQVFAEYTVRATTVTGRLCSQLYAGRLVAADEGILLLREFVDVIKAARALLPNGLADITI